MQASGTPRVGYLRTQFWLGLSGGGSVAHTNGVVNELQRQAEVAVLTNDRLAGLDPAVPQHVLPPQTPAFVPDLYREWLYNRPFRAFAEDWIRRLEVDCLYHRHTAMSQHAPWLARRTGLPFVLEFNGSQVWMARNWPVESANPMKRWHELALSPVLARLERNLFRAADRIVVAAEPLIEQVERGGGAAERCVVIPNGVDTEHYTPALSGAAVREKVGFAEDELVMGFAGTFGRWHGTTLLAQGIVRLFEQHADLREGLRFLMIGDGGLRPEAQAILERSPFADRVVFTGMLSQEDAREHLAACDVYLSPHVPNPDGSRFFGSPTKLFEYMALGRPVIASRLEQIGEILRHGRNAYLVPPGDEAALVDAMSEMARVPVLRRTLGQAARRDAVEQHSWRLHVERLLASIGEIGPKR